MGRNCVFAYMNSEHDYMRVCGDGHGKVYVYQVVGIREHEIVLLEKEIPLLIDALRKMYGSGHEVLDKNSVLERLDRIEHLLEKMVGDRG